MGSDEFENAFRVLTRVRPMSWQRRLYGEWATKNVEPKPIIDLPTGMGKTMVMAIWLLARVDNPKLGRRLIYVVDRRTVVDQATTLAVRLQRRLRALHRLAHRRPELAPLCSKYKIPAISTLRGQLADNREWSRDPSKPAIIIGTVDLIGSALLFSGYRSSFKQRPLHAGMLAQDSLLVLDEAHLSKPFEKLITEISVLQAGHGAPTVTVCMSATTARADANRFELLPADYSDAIIHERFAAPKTLTVRTTDDVIEAIATASIELPTSHPDSRIVIFVQSPRDVDAVRKSLIKKDKSLATRIAILTGTMRGLERDELVTPPERDDQHERHVMQRFLKPENNQALGACYLISTSAGEVGFDLNADHLVGDSAPLDSWIQRLGRVNRRGKGSASVFLIRDSKPADKSDMNKASIAASKLFVDGMDVSPKALAALKSTLSSDQIGTASTPAPEMVELTDILLDAWSMTSIIEPMPGRPEVAPWIRGIADELPQTTIAWRAELDLPGFDQLDLETIEEWLDTHRILPHETLSVRTDFAAKTLLDRWATFDKQEQARLAPHSVVLDRAGLKILSVAKFIEALQREDRQAGKIYDTIRNADLILPASFGGIERHKGLLDADAPKVPKDEDTKSIEERRVANDARRGAPDVADIAPGRPRLREVITKPEDGEPEPQMFGAGVRPEKPARFAIELQSNDDSLRQLVSFVPKFERLEAGSEPQSLEEHVTRVRAYANDILCRLELMPDDPVRQAVELAADWHDHGKNREFFQRTVNGKPSSGGRPWPEETRGKSGGKFFGRPPRGYRHEFGSLREFIDEHQEGKVAEDVFDLAMHLIAVHHGRGRPHFPKGGFDPVTESRSPEIHTDAIRRYARLQRKYGWWYLTWLENLLRCPDARASAEQTANGGTTK